MAECTEYRIALLGVSLCVFRGLLTRGRAYIVAEMVAIRDSCFVRDFMRIFHHTLV